MVSRGRRWPPADLCCRGGETEDDRKIEEIEEGGSTAALEHRGGQEWHRGGPDLGPQRRPPLAPRISHTFELSTFLRPPRYPWWRRNDDIRQGSRQGPTRYGGAGFSRTVLGVQRVSRVRRARQAWDTAGAGWVRAVDLQRHRARQLFRPFLALRSRLWRRRVRLPSPRYPHAYGAAAYDFIDMGNGELVVLDSRAVLGCQGCPVERGFKSDHG
jgi:hypothetical protein